MAELNHANNTPLSPRSENTERGCFDFLQKKEDKSREEDAVMADHCNTNKQEVKHTLADELQRTQTLLTSSSEEEVEEGGQRKKKKKNEEDTCIPADKDGDTVHSDETKGFIEKIKEKLPGQHKNSEEDAQITPTASTCENSPESETKERKGIIEKIKEKLPGHQKTNGNESKD